MADLYLPGIAFGNPAGVVERSFWTVIGYTLVDDVFHESVFRRESAPDRSAHEAMLRIIGTIDREKFEHLLLLLTCPACGRIFEFPLSSRMDRCTNCGSRMTRENAINESAIEYVTWSESGDALRDKMMRTALYLEKSVGKPLF